MMFGPFGDTFSDLIKEFTTAGREQLERSRLLSESRQVFRQRLLREVRLNLGILEAFSDSPAQAVSTLDGSAIKQIAEQPLDISLFFPHSLNDGAQSELAEFRKKNSQFRGVAAAIHTEADLIETIWCRLITTNAKVDQGVPVSDVKLLSALFQALKVALETPAT